MHIHVIQSHKLHTVCSYDNLTYIFAYIYHFSFNSIHIQVHAATKTSRPTKQVQLHGKLYVVSRSSICLLANQLLVVNKCTDCMVLSIHTSIPMVSPCTNLSHNWLCIPVFPVV